MKKFIALMIVLCLAATICPMAFADSSPEYVWKMALNSTTGDNCYDQGALFAQKINEISNGRVQVDLYGGAQLGSTAEIFEGMPYGVADIMVEGLGTLASFSSKANIDAMPYMYSGYDHFMAVWSSELGEEIKETIGQETGMKLMGGCYRGPRIVTATQKMEKWEDFSGFKLRAPNIDIYIKTWQWIGANPTPLAMNEVYTAIQQGTVNGQENPMADSLSYSFAEVCKYWIRTNHVYSASLFIMDSNYFNSLPEDIQGFVLEAVEYATNEIAKEQNNRDAAAAEKVLEAGCEIVDVDNADFAARFEGFAEQNYPDLADWVSRIRAMDPTK